MTISDHLRRTLRRTMTKKEWGVVHRRLRLSRLRMRYVSLKGNTLYFPGTDEVVARVISERLTT